MRENDPDIFVINTY